MCLYMINTQTAGQIICLSEEEQIQPMNVIADFFTDYPLADIRKCTGDLLKAFLTSDDEEIDSCCMRSDILYFHLRLTKMMEAAFILNKVREQQNTAA